MSEESPGSVPPLSVRGFDPLEHRPVRLLAVSSGLVLVGSYLFVLYRVTDVVGGLPWLIAYTAGAFGLATVLSRLITARVGILLGAGLFIAGFSGYLLLIPEAYYALFTVENVYADLVALVTGQSVVMLLNADLWAVSIAPGPVFLTWYLTLRQRYALAALAGAATLGFFALTGDAERITTMIGTAAALGLLGFGSIEQYEGTWEQALDLGILLALALFITRSINLIPEGRGVFGAARGGAPTLESNLIGLSGQVAVRGSISLSPEVRFSVEAADPAYWRVGSYDRYTGQGWVETGRSRAYAGPLSPPPGDTIELRQDVQVESALNAIPAAWKPIAVDSSIQGRTRVTAREGLVPTESFEAGDRFTVLSLRPDWTPEALANAGTEYPDEIRERYLQLPDSTPGRLEDLTREITADASNPQEAIRALVTWLQREKGYSLQTREARWNVADGFVFELDRGYCVHFATALCVMLRLIGVPSRFVVGYTPGKRDGERWIVRGFNAHAWVEVYFPGIEWVAVDPTPSGPRSAARQRRLRRGPTAGAAGRGGPGGSTAADGTEGAETPQDTPDDATATAGPQTPGNVSGIGNELLGPDVGQGTTARPPGSSPTPTQPNRTEPARVDVDRRHDRLSILFGAVGLTLGAYRLGVLDRAYRSVWLRRQEPTESPVADVSHAFSRLEYLLSRRFRERRPDETPRAYLAALEADGGEISDRAHRVVELYERVRYSGRPTQEEAEEAIRLVDELVNE